MSGDKYQSFQPERQPLSISSSPALTPNNHSSYSKSKDKGKSPVPGGKSESSPLLPRYEDDVLVTSINHSSISYGTTPSAAPPSTPLPTERLWIITKSAFSKLSVIILILAFLLTFIYLLQINSLREEIVKVPQLNIQQTDLDSFTSDGINVRVIGQVEMDYNKGINGSGIRYWVKRSVTKSAAFIIGSVDAGEQNITLYFDQNYNLNAHQEDDDGNKDPFVHTANATIPPLTVDIRNRHNTSFDFIVKVKDFGNPIVIGTIAQKLLANEALHFKAKSLLPISKWGLLFGKYDVNFDQVINNEDNGPDGPGDLNIHLDDIKVISKAKSFGIDVITKLTTDCLFPIEAEIPSLVWELKIPGCPNNKSSTSYQLASKGTTLPIHLTPNKRINVTVESNLLQLPFELLFPCDTASPDEKPRSPLDIFIQRYMSGETSLVTIEGSSTQHETLPQWITDIIQTISFVVPFEGKTAGDDLIKDLEFKNFRLALPPSNHQLFPPVYQPRQPPRVSATVRVRVKTPDLINIDNQMDLKVPYTRGKADLFSNDEHFAHILIDDWIPCTTEHADETNTYLIEFELDGIPVEVIDQNVFGRVMREVIVSGSSPIRVEAVVDAEVTTPLGEIVLTDLPAQGDTEIRSS